LPTRPDSTRPGEAGPGEPQHVGVTARDAGSAAPPLVEVDGLKVHFALRGGVLGRMLGRSTGSVKAVDGVSFALRRGEVLGVVGESGSGKTTLGRAMLRMAPITAGSVRFDGKDIAGLREAEVRALRRKVQMVFQDPNASLNPAMDLVTAIGHPLIIHGVTRDERELRRLVAEALERVGLSPVERFLNKFPGDLSGGQKQRAVIARAIILGPTFLVADEPVSMLDMSVRAKILELMIGLKDDLDLTYLYITHDLATAKFFCDRIAIMYLGRVVEIGSPEEIYADPKHPYTRALLRAIPEPDPRRAIPRDLPRGEIPDAARPPLGCAFHPRCPHAFGVCGWESRDLRTLLEERWTAGGDELYQSERPIVGKLDNLDEPSYVAHLPAGSARGGDDVAGLLERMRAEDPDEPMWRAVDAAEPDAGGLTVRYHEGVDPALRPVGGVEVACHLYGEYADLAKQQGADRPSPSATSRAGRKS
jgi:oligopeptide/dipeptide ABC transporter ATP-binding protein